MRQGKIQPRYGGRYEDAKRSEEDTAAECHRQGLTFLPFLVQARGEGVWPIAMRLVAHIARAGAVEEGEEVERQVGNTVRCMILAARRDNARPMLHRSLVPPTGFAASGPEAWAVDVAWQ